MDDESTIDLTRNWPLGSPAEAAEMYRQKRISGGGFQELIRLADEVATRVLNDADARGLHND